MPERSRHSSLLRLTLLAATAVAALMFAFESCKQFFFPHISLWQSHAATIIFTTLLSALAIYGVGQRMQALTRKLEEDLGERERIDAALQQSEARYRSLFEHSCAGVFRGTLDGRLLDCNEPYVQMFGSSREELLTLPAQDYYFGGKAERDAWLASFVKARQQSDAEVCYRRKDGKLVWVLQNLLIIKDENGEDVIQGTLVDITERRGLEEKLRQSQKMEAIGRLAGGIAHDFNNLLTVMQGYTRLLMDRLQNDEVSLHQVRKIEDAAGRAASLTRQLLAFSRKQVLQPKVISLNALVENLDHLLRRLIGEDVELQSMTATDLGHVKADAAQLEQVIMNLVVNARDAMPKGGRLTVETSNVELDENYSVKHPTVRPGSYVMLAVSDTGEGMSEETQARIFEPFFTTKEMGRGTGLGLSMVYGIVKQSGGHIWVYSELGHGTTFKVYLPRTAEAAESTGTAAPAAGTIRGNETILLAEDDYQLRELARTILSGYGYAVMVTKNAQEARLICEQHASSIHMLLTDVVMPGISGRELAQALLARNPAVKVLFMSGYTENAIVHHGVLDNGTFFLQKPFTPAILASKVREVLDARGAPGS
jgi:two-component system, cell cycle sensor histidine kinase and response regulator CckA